MAVTPKWVQDIIRDISIERSLPIKTVTEIVNSQFEYASKEVESGIPGKPETFKSVILKYFGTFAFNEAKHNAIERAIKTKRDAEHS